MAHFLTVADDEYRICFNVETICMFRLKQGPNGEAPDVGDLKVQIDFVGGSTKTLEGQTAQRFLTAISAAITH